MQRPKQYRPASHKPSRKFNGRKEIDNLYDRAWEKYRAIFLSTNPRCYSCGEASTVVDHLVPHKGDENLFRQLDNHLPLCKRCHDVITGLFDRRFRPGNAITEKLKWLSANRLAKNLSFKVKVLPRYGEDT